MSLDIQTRFADALFDSSKPVPQGLAAWNGPMPERRFGVYRNNVTAGLTGALASRFPATEKIVGEAFFTAMAQEFIRSYPPRSPLLLTYGDELADFVEGFEPARSLPYLPDVTRLEAARGRAYHAADAAVLDPISLATVDPERLPGLQFEMHPSVSVIRSDHPILTIWAMNVGEMPLAPIDDWTGEDALVVRPRMIVELHRLPRGGAVFLSALMRGIGLAEAAESAMQAHDVFDLSANLAGALQAGAFAAIR